MPPRLPTPSTPVGGTRTGHRDPHIRRSDPTGVHEAVTVLRPLGWDARGSLSDRDADALAVLYRSYAPMLLGVARRLVQSSTDAEDIVHDVFCRLPWVVTQYRGGGLGGWLRRATVSRALMHLRKTRQRREDELLEHLDAGSRAAESIHRLAADHGDELRAAIRELSEPLRMVVVLRYYQGYAHQEIAAMLRISPNASEVRLCRALKQLRASLGRPNGRVVAASTGRERLPAARAS